RYGYVVWLPRLHGEARQYYPRSLGWDEGRNRLLPRCLGTERWSSYLLWLLWVHGAGSSLDPSGGRRLQECGLLFVLELCRLLCRDQDARSLGCGRGYRLCPSECC